MKSASNKTVFWTVAALLLSWTQLLAPSVAATTAKVEKLYLITISPGPNVFQAFGHTILAAYDSSKPKPFTTYAYDGPDPDKILTNEALKSKDSSALLKVLKTSVEATAEKATDIEQDQDTGLPQPVINDYLKNKEKEYREVRMDELVLTDTQRKLVIKGLEEDVKAKPYEYKYYENNCATKPRDRILAHNVISWAARTTLENSTEDTSFQDIVLDSVAESVQLSNGKVITFLAKKTQRKRTIRKMIRDLKDFGVPIETEYKSEKEFFSFAKNLKDYLEKVLETTKRLSSLGAKDLIAQIQAVYDTLNELFFKKELTDKPISTYKSTFTPKRLRELLAKTPNPLLKDKPFLIDLKNTKVVTSAQYITKTTNKSADDHNAKIELLLHMRRTEIVQYNPTKDMVKQLPSKEAESTEVTPEEPNTPPAVSDTQPANPDLPSNDAEPVKPDTSVDHTEQPPTTPSESNQPPADQPASPQEPQNDASK